MQAAKNTRDVMANMTNLGHAHQEYAKHVAASRAPHSSEWIRVQFLMYPDVRKQADLLKVLPHGRTRSLNDCIDIEFEKDTRADLKRVVMTIVHNRSNAMCPMDLERGLANLVSRMEKAGEGYGNAYGED